MSLEENTVGFIGAGNMANSLIRGLLARGIPAGNLSAADIDSDKLEALHRECGIGIANSKEIGARADIIVLAVKPQVMNDVCRQMKPALESRACLVLSVAAGITSAHLQHWLGDHLALVRCMPNTPALVGKGASALYANQRVSAEQRSQAEELLTAVGLVVWLDDERLMDAVTAISGSGPAYFFLLMEALQDAALDLGLDADTARALVCQTALGAAELAGTGSATAAELRRQVTSPGGTTEQALKQFEQGDLRALVKKAVTAAERRSRELAQEFGSS